MKRKRKTKIKRRTEGMKIIRKENEREEEFEKMEGDKLKNRKDTGTQK
jgi:hypothetical protein